MASKMVTDRQKSAEAVIAVGQAQGEKLASALDHKLSLGTALGWKPGAFVQTLAATLSAARAAMVEADAAHERELADDPAVRDARDRKAGALGGTLVELREVVVGLYGAAFAQELLPGRTPQDPVVLERYAGEVSTALRKAEPPKPRVAGAHLDMKAIADDLDARRASLRKSLEAVAREAREHDMTLVARNERIAENDRVFAGVTTVLAGLFILVGEDELASRVRPSVRRPGRTADEDEAEEREESEVVEAA